MTPDALIAAAEDLIRRPDATSAGVWPRASALLARQALEDALALQWQVRPQTAELGSCSMRSQLACLATYLDPITARQVAYTWAALSNACHYHSYELGPTAAELKGWIANVRTLITHIAAQSPAQDRDEAAATNPGSC